MNKLRVLMYHKADPEKRDFLTVCTSDLDRQFRYIKKNYNVIRMSELLASLDDPGKLPAKPLLITFDDAYLNNVNFAWPLLKKYGLPFTVFPVTSFIGRKVLYDGTEQEFMGCQDMESMSDLAEFGFHGFEHAALGDMDKNRMQQEIGETISKFPCRNVSILPVWAYTYGSFPKNNPERFAELTEIFRNAGIKAAFRIGNRLNTIPLNNQYSIQRLDIRGNRSFTRFVFQLLFGKIF